MRWLPLLFLLACNGPGIGPREGMRAPELGQSDTDGHTITLADLKGKPALVVFWASWCGPCRHETPAVAKVAQSYQDRIHVVGVNAGEDVATVKEAASELGITWPVLLDPQNSLQRRYNVDAIPLMLVFDKDGLIRYRGNGLPSDIYRLLDGLLG